VFNKLSCPDNILDLATLSEIIEESEHIIEQVSTLISITFNLPPITEERLEVPPIKLDSPPIIAELCEPPLIVEVVDAKTPAYKELETSFPIPPATISKLAPVTLLFAPIVIPEDIIQSVNKQPVITIVSAVTGPTVPPESGK